MFFEYLLPKKLAAFCLVRTGTLTALLVLALLYVFIPTVAHAMGYFPNPENNYGNGSNGYFGEDKTTEDNSGGSAGYNGVVGNHSEVPYETPDNAQADVNPRSMVVMSNDHQLFFKAYTDWSDVDNDGDIDSTFDETIIYYGYFDSDACYIYDAALDGGGFRYASATNGADFCAGAGNSKWSGNFLNWVSMTRMDIVRKVLYGGKRFRDNDSQTTILERAYLPYDAHSFVKVVDDGPLLNRHTPFNGNKSVSFCNTTGYSGTGQSKDVDEPPLIRVAEGEWRNWAANERFQCTWRNEPKRSNGDRNKRPPAR